MRPLFLKFAGIGSFPKGVDIDFNELGTMGLYLIIGRTGAGKTTIFDAMTYALYGKVAADRENAIVNGHPGRDNPFIEFTFEHAGTTYIAHREPALPGKSVATNKQWLSILDANNQEIRRISQTKQVNEKVKEIIGLNDSEFMQVILLPQGKFQQFLLAKSNDKKGMLQAIFGTSAYKRIVDQMVNSVKRLQADLDKDSEEINNQWAIIGNAHDRLIDQQIFNSLPDYQEETNELITLVEQQASITKLEAETANETYANAKNSRIQAISEADRFDKSSELARLQSEQNATAQAVKRAQVAVANHETAEPINEAISSRDLLKSGIKVLAFEEKNSRSSLARHTSCIKVKSETLKKFIDAIPTASPSVLAGEFAKVESVLHTAEVKYEELTHLLREINVLESSITKWNHLQAKKLLKLETVTKQVIVVKKEIDDSRKATRSLKDVERKVEQLEELLEEADDTEAKTAVSKATRLRDRRKSEFDHLATTLKNQQNKRTKQLAGDLAADLSDGCECPVCGSLNHPKKAKKIDVVIDLQSLSEKRDYQFELLKEAEQDLKEAQKALAKAISANSKLPTASEQRELHKRYQTLLKQSEREEVLNERLETLISDEKKIEKELSDAKVSLTEDKTKLSGFEKRFTILTKETQTVGTSVQVDEAISSLSEIGDALDELNEKFDELNEKNGQFTQASKNTTKLLTKSGFASEKLAVAAILEDFVLDELQKLISMDQERTKTIGQLKAAIGDKLVPDQRPDLEDLEARVKLAIENNETAQHRNGVVKGSLRDISKAFKAIKNIGPAFAEKQYQMQSANNIATIFKDGTVSASGKQLDLETWVLRTLFEEVCLVANDQMRQLSSNRYTLTLDQEAGGVAKRRGGGLDIYVLDAQTGLTRPVQTMSGGEQFIASLALSLALAEVVQRHAGGIEVPCLFIDEGFGGLDLETLDIAIDVLQDIQATGRSVGIITHVETMQQLLPIGIRIHKGHSGSTLEVLPPT
jgi:exonuclease SbcC